MAVAFSTGLLALVVAIVFAGGMVKGIVGFGYSVTGTAVLAVVIDPTSAIVLMIVPMLVGNVSLVRELHLDGVRACLDRFWLYLLAATAGVLAGMTFIDRVPTAWVAFTLGIVVLGYVAARQDEVALPGSVPAQFFDERSAVKATMGVASGVVFGASNIAIQTVVYLDRLDLDRSTFVGVLSMFLAVLSMVRVGAAMALGLYDAGGVFELSLLAAPVGFVGVAAGRRTRHLMPERLCEVGVLVLFTVVGSKLLYDGVAGLFV